jgi:peptidoglycan/LPS O-acetylase OafA/YrhL
MSKQNIKWFNPDKKSKICIGIILALTILVAVLSYKMKDWHFREWLCANSYSNVCIDIYPPPQEVFEEMKKGEKHFNLNY